MGNAGRGRLARGHGSSGDGFLAANLHFYGTLRRSRRKIECPGAGLPVYESRAIETPCLFGLFRPAVYITPETAADRETLRYALAHERTHCRHGDHLWALLRGTCLALHWWDPLVWWAAELSRRDAELACDEDAVRGLGEHERAAYGRTLIRMTCEKRAAPLLTATMMTDSGRGLRERIALLVKRPKTTARAAPLPCWRSCRFPPPAPLRAERAAHRRNPERCGRKRAAPGASCFPTPSRMLLQIIWSRIRSLRTPWARSCATRPCRTERGSCAIGSRGASTRNTGPSAGEIRSCASARRTAHTAESTARSRFPTCGRLPHPRAPGRGLFCL